jgi:hypothetical protein
MTPMTTLLMSSLVDGAIAALGILAGVILLISSLAMSESNSAAQVESPRIRPAKRAA